MDYKGKYEQALEVAKETYDKQPMYRKWLEKMFPELSESEDEKVRKEMIDFAIKANNGVTSILANNYDFNKWLAWLEKQGEPTDINPSEFDLRLNKLLKQFETLPKEEIVNSLSFYLNVVQNDGTYKPDKKQGESYGQRKECLGCQFNYAGECKGSCAMKRDEQKPAEWSEDDTSIAVNNPKAYRIGFADGEAHAKEEINTEWSEEEEHYICQLESTVKERWALAEKAQDEEVVKNMSDLAFFLKTLNPNKKPSDEEMKELLRTEYEKGRADAINRACVWLSNVLIEDMEYKYNNFDTSEGWYKFIEDFKKYMNEDS